MKFRYTQKENVDKLLRLRLLRYRQTPIYLKRANAHAERRELLLQFLVVSVNWRFSDDKNLKVDIHPICPYFQLFHSLPIGICGFKGYTLLYRLFQFLRIHSHISRNSETVNQRLTLGIELLVR